MTKPKSDYRRSKRGHPGYDKLGLYLRFEANRRITGKSENALAKEMVLTMADAGLPPENWPQVTGGTLRSHIQKFKKEHIANELPHTVAAIDRLVEREMALIRA